MLFYLGDDGWYIDPLLVGPVCVGDVFGQAMEVEVHGLTCGMWLIYRWVGRSRW